VLRVVEEVMERTSCHTIKTTTVSVPNTSPDKELLEAVHDAARDYVDIDTRVGDWCTSDWRVQKLAAYRDLKATLQNYAEGR